MKRIGLIVAALLVASVVGFAHGDNDHVRGVVTQISAQSVTLQVGGKGTKTLALNAKTTFEKSGKAAQLKDLKVGDRVIIDVPKGTLEARLIRFGAPTKSGEAAKSVHDHDR